MFHERPCHLRLVKMVDVPGHCPRLEACWLTAAHHQAQVQDIRFRGLGVSGFGFRAHLGLMVAVLAKGFAISEPFRVQ